MDIEYSYGCVYYSGFDIITMDVYHFTFTPLYNSIDKCNLTYMAALERNASRTPFRI